MRSKAQQLLSEAFGIYFPYHKMGRIDSFHLFGLDTEMVIFAAYKEHIGKWKRVLDIGANLGLHSILLAKYGFQVEAYEPDFEHYVHLLENLDLNQVRGRVNPHMAAVSTETGNAQFIRVHNNLTGNHLWGYKDSYGPRETVIVPTVDVRELWKHFDFVKIDSEGNEADLLRTTTYNDWKHMEAVVEVRNTKNAELIYEYLTAIDVPMWSQKTEWSRVYKVDDMPKQNRDGSLWIGRQGPFS